MAIYRKRGGRIWYAEVYVRVAGRRFHDFRHTFASRLADAGVGTETIKLLGGWTQTATALRYQHSERLAELRAAIRAVEGTA